MTRIEDKFAELRSRNEKALITYMMAGYPSKAGAMSVIQGMVNGGADIIEIGFPFSDPLADGPVIQNAGTISLQNNTTVDEFLPILEKMRAKTDVPLVLMTYANILYRTGYDKFIKKISRAGIDGIILPDMPIEESGKYLDAAKKYNIDTIFLVSPNTSKSRLAKIAKVSTGFLYLVSVYGTTGARTRFADYTKHAVKNTLGIINGSIPVGVGFGVSTPADVQRLVSMGADAAIVGSALLQLTKNTQPRMLENKIAAFVKRLKDQTRISVAKPEQESRLNQT